MSPIDFYQNNKNQVEMFGMMHLADREERQLFRLGKQMLEATRVAKVAAAKGNETYEDEHYMFIIDRYVMGKGRKAIASAFTTIFETHIVESTVEWFCSKLESMDITHTGRTKPIVGAPQRLTELALQTHPNRFTV